MAMLTLRIPDELMARLDDIAKRSGRTKTYYVKEMIKIAIEELEEEVWAQEAMFERLRNQAKGSKQVFTLDEVRKRLDELDRADKARSSKTTGEAD
jgi:RHH-type transcriptional regulator, rel operon repressor / antitoxin RelB